jgi:hypothetical protein
MLEFSFAGYSIPTLRVLILSIVLLIATQTSAQTPTDTPEKDLWPTLSATFEFSSRFHLQATAENHHSIDSPFDQWELGAIFIYERLLKIWSHDADIVLGGGYEFVRVNENGSIKREHRIVFQSTPKHSIGLGLLVQDRNRLEFRWKEEGYNFRYRNKLIIDRPFQIGSVAFIPYAAGELFWDRNSHAWNENRYAFGVRLPYKKALVLDTFYLRRNCTGCRRTPTDVLGMTVNLYIKPKKAR